MRRYALLTVLLTPAQARAASASWFAQGSGTVLNTADFPVPMVERWQWVAMSPAGDSATGATAKGHFSARVLGTPSGFDADVTCLNVQGNSARIGITITRSTNELRPVDATTWITMTSVGQGVDALHLVGADHNGVPPVCIPPSGAVDPFYGTIGIRAETTPGSWIAQAAGTRTGTEEDWQWIATSDVGGTNAKGHLSMRDSSTNTGFDAEVTCLNIAGDSARIGLRITSSSDPSRPLGGNTYIHMTTTGNGNSQVNQFLPDWASGYYPTLSDPCTSPAPGGFAFDGTMNLNE
jgi:sRNA-binding carbon storage regulator CsrA